MTEFDQRAEKNRKWLIKCDMCGKEARGINEEAVKHKAAHTDRWLGGFMVEDDEWHKRLEVGSVYHEKSHLHFCCLQCAKDYKATHNIKK